MANPSLQIGNSNWAIKEDNFLGYSTVGTNYLPKPITMTRASAGTRVNSSGLVETVDLVIGAEFINNTNFETDTNWGGAISINTTTQQLTKTGGGLGYQISGGIIAGTSYKIVVDVASLDGATTVWVAGNNYNLSVGIQTIYAIGGTNSWNGGIIAINNGYASGTGSVFNSISVKEAAIDDLARVDYDGTASSLLVEPQRINLVTYSEDYTVYTPTRTTITSSYGTSPNGGQNSTAIFNTTETGAHNLNGSYFSVTSGTSYVNSVFAKAGTITKMKLRLFSGGGTLIGFNDGVFDLTNGTATGVGASIESYGNGWYRCYMVDSPTSSVSNARFNIGLLNADGDSNYTGLITDYIEVFGSEVSAGSYATSYIPTSGSTVTRAQDQYSKTGISNLINSEEGVLFVEFENIVDSAAAVTMLSLSDGSVTNKIGLFVSGGQISVESAGSGTNLGIYSKTLQSGFNKIAVKYKVNNCALWVNGTGYTDTSFTAFSSSTLNSLVFDRGDAGQPFFGKVRQLQIYKTTDIDLAALTS